MRIKHLICLLFILFSISTQAQINHPKLINGVAVPSDFPDWEPTFIDTTAPGYIWLNNWGGSPYVMMLENDGTPAFYMRTEQRARDFKLHPDGKTISRRLRDKPNGFMTYDIYFNPLDTIYAQNGYTTDEHELHIAPNGNYLIIVLEEKVMDLSAYGGSKSAFVLGNHIQELNKKLEVVFEWKCWDHVRPEETYWNIEADRLDYLHMNSIAVDVDGNLLVSCRHTSQCLKIDRQSGEIICRIGGKKNQFTFADDDVQNSAQHDIRPVPGKPGHYTIFDNGNTREGIKFSRAVEYKLDTTKMTAEKVWEYKPEPRIYSHFMGNTQRLPNGNTFINFAASYRPKAVEVTPEGKVVYTADFKGDLACYRAFRFEWKGMLEQPYLEIEALPQRISLIYNKFGDASVDHYRIYADTFSNNTTLLDTCSLSWYNLANLKKNARYFIRVSAVDYKGYESELSEECSVVYTLPENYADIVKNGDFSEKNSYWSFTNEANGTGALLISDTAYVKIQVSEPGNQIYSVQLKQAGIPLYKDVKYRFSFDALVEKARIIEAKVGQHVSPFTNYSKIGYTYLKAGLQHYEYEFVMEDPTDLNSRVVFNVGQYEGDVWIGNVKVIQIFKEVEDTTGVKDLIFSNTISKNDLVYYNKNIHSLCLKEPTPKAQSLKIFDINGRMVFAIDKPGDVPIKVNALLPGVYVVSLQYTKSISSQKIVIY